MESYLFPLLALLLAGCEDHRARQIDDDILNNV